MSIRTLQRADGFERLGEWAAAPVLPPGLIDWRADRHRSLHGRADASRHVGYESWVEPAADREGFQDLVAEVSLGRAGAIQRITTENTTLKQRVWQLTTDNRTLDERLKAARSNLRFRDRRVADLEAQLLDLPQK